VSDPRSSSADQAPAAAPPRLSFVVPVKDEADNVVTLHQEIALAMREVGGSWELIFIDDGSADATFERVRDLHAQHPEVRVIRFSRNFGKSAALTAGFAAARGEIIFTLDGDLQDDPVEIPRFLAALDQGHNLVCGWKRKRLDPVGKRVASRIFNWTMARLTGLNLHDVNCGYKAYRAPVAHSLRLRRGLHRFIPFLAKAKGYPIGEIVVAHRARIHGRSKYGWERIPQALVDVHLAWLVARGIERPLIALGAPGAVLFIAGAVALGAATRLSGVSLGLLLAVGAILVIVGADLLIMAPLVHGVMAREPEGGAYSVAERLD
jgi:glycosyltransferase involved in cell wall biosynthesis